MQHACGRKGPDGGQAAYSSVRIDLRRITTLKDAKGAIGSRIRARVVKNKIAPPFREAEFDMMFDGGISYEGDVIDLALAAEIIQRSGAWLNYGDMRLGQGRDNAKKYFQDNPALCEEIRNKVLEVKGFTQPRTAASSAESE